MKKILFLAAIILMQTAVMTQAQTPKAKTAKTPSAAPAGKWNLDPMHSSVKFTVTHLTISEVEGSFKMFTGTIDAAKPDFNNAQINFTVDVPSISTDNEMRDKHLKSDDFFNAEKFPKMTFTSASFKKVRGNVYSLEGNLTIRDVTKKVRFAVLYGGTMVDPYGNTKAGFKATGSISRAAYNLKWNKLTEAGGAVVGDEVKIVVAIEAGLAK